MIQFLRINRIINKKGIASLLFFFSIIITFSILFSLNHFDKDIQFATGFISLYIIVLSCLWNAGNRRLSPLILIFLSIGIFIGGRFIAVLLGYEKGLFQPTFFRDYYVSLDRKHVLFSYIIVFIESICIGGFLGLTRKSSRNLDIKISLQEINYINRILYFAFYFFLFHIISSGIYYIILALNNGYLSLYISNQTGNYGGSNLIKNLLFVFFGLAFGYGTLENKKKYLFLFILQALLQLIVGVRGGFGIMFLILIWFYSFKHKISLLGMFILGIGGILSLIFIYSFSIRQLGSDLKFDSISLISSFFYSQGIQLMCFDGTRMIETFPTLPYFQSLFPGVTYVFNLVTGETVPFSHIDFSNYLSYSLNPQAYYEGMGLGWSTISDLYLYSGRNILIFFILGIFVAFFIAKMWECAKKSKVQKFIIFTIIYPLIRWPRGGVNDVMPLVWYAIIILFLIIISYKLLVINQND